MNRGAEGPALGTQEVRWQLEGAEVTKVSGLPEDGIYPGGHGEGAPPSPVPRPRTASTEPSQEMPVGPFAGPIAEQWVSES